MKTKLMISLFLVVLVALAICAGKTIYSNNTGKANFGSIRPAIDNHGSRKMIIANPNINVNSATRGPVAFAGSEQVVLVGEPLEFFGAGACPNYEIYQYTWDFESDDIEDFVSTQTGFTTHQFDTPGEYWCLLTVKDSVGRVAQDRRHIIVVTEKDDLEFARMLLYSPKSVVRNTPDGETHRYAIMINGGSETRYWTDMELAYDMLISYGFSQQDIYLLNHNGTNPDGNNPDSMIDYSAQFANLENVFNELTAKVDEDDELFLWITDHGIGYSGPLDTFYGYLDSRASVDPGDELDYLESEFKLRSLCTYGNYYCNHGLNVWKVCKRYSNPTKFFRNKYVSSLDNVYFEALGYTVSDSDVYIERLIDYALGDTNRDGYIDEGAGEVFDFDGDSNPPYDPDTDQFDEDDWGVIDILEDDYNALNTQLPENGAPIKLFDEGFQGKLCIDLGYAGGVPEVDGRDEDNVGLFDWMDVNQDGDTNDIISVDEAVCLYSGKSLYDDDLAEFVNQLSPAKAVFVAQQCFSGGLIEDLTSPTRSICTATIEEAVSYGNAFFRNFVASLHEQDGYENPVNADADDNGYISIVEAFNYAAGENSHDVSRPQYDDNGDGVYHTNPIPTGGDGDFGANIYLCKLGAPTIATPTFSPDGGTYPTLQNVIISCPNPGAIVYYTTDGSKPTQNSTMYEEPVLVDRRMVLKARAFETSCIPSKIKMSVYLIPSYKVIHVKPDGNDINDGLTWHTAKQTVTAGLNSATSGDDVWVKGDTNNCYYESITLKDGVALYGGFVGNEISLNQRPAFPRPAADSYETILDGNQQGSVVKFPSGVSAITVLDGCIVTGGHTNSSYPDNKGGGILCDSGSSPTISYCTIVGNWAMYGGGISCMRNSKPTINHCTILGNSTTNGGGICCIDDSSPKINNCIIASNSASQVGGGIYCKASWLKMTNCTVSGNQAWYGGGGIYCQAGTSMVNNSILWGNNSNYYGHEISLMSSSSPSYLTHLMVSYSNVTGGKVAVYLKQNCALNWESTNINANPLFANPNNGDYHLKSKAGRWDPVSENWIVDDVSSPCIDAGDPNVPVGDEPMPNGDRINMGAYGGTSEASKSIAITNSRF